MAAVATGSAPGEAVAPIQPARDHALGSGNARFAFDFYAQLRSRPGNLFVSPASLSTAFGMAYAGARGATGTQIADVFHFDEPADRLGNDMRQLLARWNGNGNSGAAARRSYQLSVVNAFWGRAGYPFAPPFTRMLQDRYGATIHPVNFRDAEAARQQIDGWVAQQTHDKIRDVIPARGLDMATVLVLTNAIYFKAAWDHPFYPEATAPAPFHLAGGAAADVPMMRQLGEFRYLKGDRFVALEMTYAADALSMIVLLPDDAKGLPEFERSVTADRLAEWTRQLQAKDRQDVRVTFPRFRYTSDVALPPVLSAMGMPLAFSSRADFSGMNEGREPLLITAAYHQALVDVDEHGTEAAAATALMAAGVAMPRAIPVFNADHPFMFVIRENQSGSILFIGRVVDPRG